jgi:hypothetical protein
MKKENRPGQQAVNSDTRGSDVTPPAYTVQASKRIPKKHRARTYMLRCGAGGWTENDILRNCRPSSGRNYATELERELSIYLERLEEKNPDRIGAHMRNRSACRNDVMKVIQFVNHMAAINQHCGLSVQDITDILNLYPGNLTAA